MKNAVACPFCRNKPWVSRGIAQCATHDCPNDIEIPVEEWNLRLGHKQCEPFYIPPEEARSIIIVSYDGKTAETELTQDNLPVVRKYIEAIEEAANG